MKRKVSETVVFSIVLFLGFTSVLIDAQCKSNEWSCNDGTCIDAKLTCNGAVDCHDRSDETFLLCRHRGNCPRENSFACTYGACVPKSAKCNGIKDCADNSDELLFECRNETSYYDCQALNYKHNLTTDCGLQANICKNGQVIKSSKFIKCNGRVECDDGSDETLESCSGFWLPNCIGWLFSCQYGGCLDPSKACNGEIDCIDGSDELPGVCDSDNGYSEELGDWQCNDGTIIPKRLKCNGAMDCPDGSDETFLHCRDNFCHPEYAKCVYGGCVPKKAICNGVQDCADNSDELLDECQGKSRITRDGVNRCKNGQLLSNYDDWCNGRADCEDGSDETLEYCATPRPSNPTEFNIRRCEYGAYIAKDKVCNKVKDCFDGSDELDGHCHKGKCVLPEYPKNGSYTVLDPPDALPGQVLDSAVLVFDCLPGFRLLGTSRNANCLKGTWSYNRPPQCLAQCRLKKNPSVIYWCLPRGPLSLQGEKECGLSVPDGATVRPVCREPFFHNAGGELPFMHCVGDRWDRQAPICSPQCGLVTPEADRLVINGTSAKRGELPWHAGIYDKRSKPYEQICGGSLISRTIVISAAHCFWSDLEKLQPARNYAVALGKLYRPWNDAHEIGDQKSDVREIILPPHFRGSATNFQDDIALVILVLIVEYRSYVLPVCIDFSNSFEKKQLAVGNSGKVPGWGLTAEDGKESPVLKVAELPFLDINSCFDQSPSAFYKFITGDKFCAGNYNSSALCKGDSGGGLVFASYDRSEERYFLRGVVSTAPRNDHACNAFVHTTFTQISKHQAFILEHWK